MARVLLADDDQATCELVARALSGDGHDVEIAADGQEALDRFLAAPESFALVIADVQMPLIDGIALIEQVRAAHPGIKAVLMSALSGELVRAQRLAATGVQLVSKPISLEALRAQVRQLLT